MMIRVTVAKYFSDPVLKEVPAFIKKAGKYRQILTIGTLERGKNPRLFIVEFTDGSSSFFDRRDKVSIVRSFLSSQRCV